MRISNEDALKLINSLRNGTSPVYHSEALSTGREAELEAFREALERLHEGSGLVRLITGAFGAGKSFLVQNFKDAALKEDFIIASFQLNNGFRLNKLDDLYYAIMHHLYLKDKPNTKVSFDDIFDLWVHNLQNAPHADRKRYEVNTVCQELSKYNMNFARAFLSFMRGRIQRNQEMMSVACAWLTGERHIPVELKQKYELVGAVDKTNTIDFLKAFIKLITLLDYSGLVVFIDEVDLVLNDRSDIRQTAYNNFKHLVDLATSGEMSNVMFVFSGNETLITDEQKGLLSNTPLAQRLNLTQDRVDLNQKHQTVIHVDPLDSDALIRLTDKILKLYRQCYVLPEFCTSEHAYAYVSSQMTAEDAVTRHYVIALTAYLDALKTQ